MCNEFSKLSNNIIFLFPKSSPLSQDDFKSIESFLNENIHFKIKTIFSIDFMFIKNLNLKVWFYLKSMTFKFFLIIFLIKNRNEQIYIRERRSLKLILFLKMLGILKNKIFFEAHEYKFKNKRLLKFCNKLIVINQQLKNIYSEIYNNSILVSHDAVSKNELTKYNFKSNLNNHPIILYTGSFYSWKGVDLIISAATKLSDFNFVLIGGDQDNLKRLNKIVLKNNLKNVELLPKVNRNHLYKYIVNSDILLLPNLDVQINNWTSPLKLFEYMASKRLIIASNLPSLMEILTHNHNAILFNPRLEDDLVSKILYSLNNYDLRIVEQAFNDVKKHTWTNRAYEILKFIK